MTIYMYAPQESYDIPKALINEYVVDLSRFNNLKGVTGKTTAHDIYVVHSRQLINTYYKSITL